MTTTQVMLAIFRLWNTGAIQVFVVKNSRYRWREYSLGGKLMSPAALNEIGMTIRLGTTR